MSLPSLQKTLEFFELKKIRILFLFQKQLLQNQMWTQKFWSRDTKHCERKETSHVTAESGKALKSNETLTFLQSLFLLVAQ